MAVYQKGYIATRGGGVIEIRRWERWERWGNTMASSRSTVGSTVGERWGNGGDSDRLVSLGIDPGALAGGMAALDGRRPLWVGWWSARSAFGAVSVVRVTSDGVRTTYDAAGLRDALLWLSGGPWRGPVACEAVAPFRGRSGTAVLAAAAREACAVVGGRVARPRPELWRRVYAGGRPVAVRREDAKRLALAALHGRPCVGAAWLVTPWDVVAWPADVPDHAAEALGLAAWVRDKP